MQALAKLVEREEAFIVAMVGEKFLTCPACGGYDCGRQVHQMRKAGNGYVCDNRHCEFRHQYGHRMVVARPVPSEDQIRRAAEMRRELREFATVHSIQQKLYKTSRTRAGFTRRGESAKLPQLSQADYAEAAADELPGDD